MSGCSVTILHENLKENKWNGSCHILNQNPSIILNQLEWINYIYFFPKSSARRNKKLNCKIQESPSLLAPMFYKMRSYKILTLFCSAFLLQFSVRGNTKPPYATNIKLYSKQIPRQISLKTANWQKSFRRFVKFFWSCF